jgi:CheY-like chemotaxis protein
MRVLIVDDDTLGTRAFRRLFEDHEVVIANSVPEAQQTIIDLGVEANAFDLVLSDVMMGEHTGADLHRWLLAHHPILTTRMIFMTGGIPDHTVRAYIAGLDNEVITKPDLDRIRELARGVRVPSHPSPRIPTTCDAAAPPSKRGRPDPT